MSLIVALGGTMKAQSSTERALRLAADAAREKGAEVVFYGSEFLLNLPHFGTDASYDAQEAKDFIETVRRSSGLLMASPGYHGSVSGLVKNAIDYLELMAKDKQPYLHGRPVGVIATAYGHQAAMSTTMSLRSIVHALRGWPTPMAAALRVTSTTFDGQGNCTDDKIAQQLYMVGTQVVEGPMR